MKKKIISFFKKNSTAVLIKVRKLPSGLNLVTEDEIVSLKTFFTSTL